jgi:peptide deformylase
MSSEEVLDLSKPGEVPAPVDLGEEEPEEEEEKISFTTAEGIELPEIVPQVPKIAVYPVFEKVLRTVSEPVTEEMARSEEFRIHVSYMLCGIYNTQQPGIGLASVQIGMPLQAIVIDPEWPQTNETAPKVLLNPVILLKEGEQNSREGCLSVPLDYRQVVKRAQSIVVGAVTLDWEPIEFESEGFEAAVIQHEIDHMNGILFIDHLSRLKRDMYRRKLIKYARRQYKTHKRMQHAERMHNRAG